jgi:hypothetical protein
MGTPVWSHAGIICTGESYKKVVKLTFAKGASLKDPARIFNSSLEGNVRRAIDIHEGEEVDESAFKALSPSGCPQRFSQVERFEDGEVLKGFRPRRGPTSGWRRCVVPRERSQVEQGPDGSKSE